MLAIYLCLDIFFFQFYSINAYLLTIIESSLGNYVIFRNPTYDLYVHSTPTPESTGSRYLRIFILAVSIRTREVELVSGTMRLSDLPILLIKHRVLLFAVLGQVNALSYHDVVLLEVLTSLYAVEIMLEQKLLYQTAQRL